MKKIKISLSTLLLLSSIVVTPAITLAEGIENSDHNKTRTTEAQTESETETIESETETIESETETTETETETTESTTESTTGSTTEPTEPTPTEPNGSNNSNVSNGSNGSNNSNNSNGSNGSTANNSNKDKGKGKGKDSKNKDSKNKNSKPNKKENNTNKGAVGSQVFSNNIGVSNGVISITPNQTSQEFIDTIGPLAEEVADEYGLYASVMIAQAALESAYGKSSLSLAPNYNLFGIKGTYENAAINLPTLEDAGSGSMYQIFANFRKYPSYKESLEDYAKLIKNGIAGSKTFYNGVWKENTKTYEDATKFLTGKYATDTSYNKKLNGIIEAYDLTQYDDGTMTKDRVYTIKKGDTLEKITKKEKVKLENILKLNKDIKNKNVIEVGKKIILEKGKKVKRQSNGKGNGSIVSYARDYFGVPYVWGGTTPAGFDCSGFVQYIYAKAGIKMPRVTTQQEHIGKEVAISKVVPGDLLFWGAKGQTYHVAVYSGNGNMIMAPQPGDVVKELPVASFMPDFAMYTV